MNNTQDILDLISSKSSWQDFLEYKIESHHITKMESDSLRMFIENERFLELASAIESGTFPEENPTRLIVNKQGTNKKRIVYSFSKDVSFILKFVSYHLYKYDFRFADNCYAFRKNFGVGNAFRRITALHYMENLSDKYCLKVDISNYFNSIDVNILIDKLSFIDDQSLTSIFSNILTNEFVISGKEIVMDNHGAMAGLPLSPFFANVYLSDTDKLFNDLGIIYFRYSDDILIFADSMDELNKYQKLLYGEFDKLHLSVNPEKEHVYLPHEIWEFLGFSFDNGIIDLSLNTKKKIKAKIKRKAHALMRWARSKNLPPERAVVGFINSMNKKFYGYDDEDDFTWSRWFFPILNTDEGLKEIDHYMQQYIRYIMTGRHYKGNYKIGYEQLKRWGYRNLVNEFYK